MDIVKKALIAELKHESMSTRKILEKAPVESFSWKPHEKSMTLGRLSTHIAEIPRWVSGIINYDEYDFAAHPFKPHIALSQQELIDIFHEKIDEALTVLESVDDAILDKKWVVRHGETIFYELPKKVAVRSWSYNHLYHHRGQLSVYLRLLGIDVPGMYGPSADERM